MKQILVKTVSIFLIIVGLFGASLLNASLVSAITPVPTCQPNQCGAGGDDCYDFCTGGCTYLYQCINNTRCEISPVGGTQKILMLSQNGCGSAIVGKITPPASIINYNSQATGESVKIGAVIFASRLLNILTIIAGLWVIANFIIGGFEFVINSGTPDTMNKVKEKIIFSMVGIVIIVAAYAIAGAAGLIFFGDASFILKPNIIKYGATFTP